ncbi:cation-transporting ATPase, partial [Candidatus Thiomargarita nelsonii]
MSSKLLLPKLKLWTPKDIKSVEYMLLEVSIVIGVYFGVRRFGHDDEKPPKKKKSKCIQPINSSEKKVATKNTSVKPLEGFQENTVVNETINEHDHQLKISTVNLGIAAIRQFIYPPIAPLFLGMFIYNNFTLYKRAENSLIQRRKIDNYVSSAIASFIAISIGQYFATAVGGFFYHLNEKIITKTQKSTQNWLTNAFEQLPSMVWVLRDNVEIEIP